MYELFILSKLLHRPMHGYLIQTILNAAIGPFRRLSWGTLYPMMKRLEKSGYVAAIEDGTGDPRGKKTYRTTEAGRRRFLQMMTAQGNYDADYRDLFRLKLGCFGNVEEDVRQMILGDYRACLTKVLEYSATMIERIESDSAVPADEKRFALLGLEHQTMLAKSESEWVDSLKFEQAAWASAEKKRQRPPGKRV
jgi:DNA-binding PadR family transcriptional regulator